MVMNETEVYAAPMTEVSAAAHRISPKTRRPTSPAAAWKALAAGSSVASVTPPATTPRTARNSSTRITPVTRMPTTELRVIVPDVLDAGLAGVEQPVRAGVGDVAADGAADDAW